MDQEIMVPASNSLNLSILKAAASLNNMVREMQKKHIELKRVTKTVAILLDAGISPNSINDVLAEKCVAAQNSDGGWVAIVDTMWNCYFLKKYNSLLYNKQIVSGLEYLKNNVGPSNIWGRSKRDMERIPVTGVMLHLFDELATNENLNSLENLWLKERNSLTYKAAYTLLAFKANNFIPETPYLIEDTISWIISNQRSDGSFAPWKEHPVQSDIFCTAVATIGLLAYKELAPPEIILQAIAWIQENQLPTGVWPFHEIEDGASWALRALALARNNNAIKVAWSAEFVGSSLKNSP